jgi:hypothetical protein
MSMLAPASTQIVAQIFLRAANLGPLSLGMIIALALAVLWLYRPQVTELNGGWRALLPMLRVIAVLALAASLVKPVAVRPASASERGVVAVLVDRSKSMSVTDTSRSTAQLVALADALGMLPGGARTDAQSGMAAAIDRLGRLAAEVNSALDDLDYARVSGREIQLRQAHAGQAIADYSHAATALSARAESIDPEAELNRRLSDLSLAPPPEARQAWKTDVPARIARAADALSAYQSAADEQLYQTREDVRSACMKVAQLSRLGLVQEALMGPRGVLPRIRQEGAVTGFGISDIAQPMDLPSKGALGIAPDGYTTNLVDGIAEAIAGRNVRAVVLFSDGRQVSGDSVIFPGVVPAGVPVFTVGAAAPVAPRDLSFARVMVPSTVFAGQQFQVRVELRHEGIDRADVAVHLQAPEAGEQTRQIQLREGRKPAASYTLRLSRPGAQKIRLWFAKSEKEISDANNQVERWIKVVPRRMKVLLIAGSPTWDFQFVRSALGRAQEMEVSQAVLAPGGKLGVSRRDIADQDVVVLFDPPAGAISNTQWDELEQLAQRKGGSVILVAGSHFPANFGRTAPIPVARLLPYRVLGYTPAWRIWPGESPDFHFVPSADAESLDVLRLADPESTVAGEGALSRWEQLPGCYRFLQLPDMNDRDNRKPDVKPLLVESESRLPVLTEMRLGAGRAFFLATDETWRWRFKSSEGDQDRFWRQLVSYASDQPYFQRNEWLALDADKVAAQPNEPIRIRARLADEQARNSKIQDLEVLRDGKVWSTRVLEPVGADGSGRFAATISLPTGEFLLRWSLALPRGKSTAVQMPLHVAASDEAELMDLSGNDKMLRQIADATSGQFLTLEQVNSLPDRLEIAGDKSQRMVEFALWDSPYLFCFVLGCLGVEWALRKKYGLS